MAQTLSAKTLIPLCDQLAKTDPDLLHIIDMYGYPPFWSRPNTFETLVHIILEQQVSLASAKASLEKLRHQVQHVAPETVLQLSVDEFKACYVSRQKARYITELAKELVNGKLNLKTLESLPNDAVRARLVQLIGIGNWTVNIYLIMVLHRLNVFAYGDLAAVNALKKLKQLPNSASMDSLLSITSDWQPYNTVATILLWHYYLESKKTVFSSN